MGGGEIKFDAAGRRSLDSVGYAEQPAREFYQALQGRGCCKGIVLGYTVAGCSHRNDVAPGSPVSSPEQLIIHAKNHLLERRISSRSGESQHQCPVAR